MKEWIFKVVVPILTALLTLAAALHIPPNWAPWLMVAIGAAAVVTICYGLVAFFQAVGPNVARWIREKRIDSSVQHDLIALIAQFTDATNSSFTLSAGSVLNALNEAKASDARMVTMWGGHLNTLQLATRNLGIDVGRNRLRTTEALIRLCELQRDYLRVCATLYEVVLQSNHPAIRRNWEAISDYANSLSTQLTNTTHRVQARRAEQIQCYFERISKWFLNTDILDFLRNLSSCLLIARFVSFKN